MNIHCRYFDTLTRILRVIPMRRHRCCTVPPRSVFVLAAVIMATVPLAAQNPQPDSLDVQWVFDMEEVVVTARRKSEIIPSQRLDGELISRLNSHSIADAVRYFSGVQLKDYGGVGGLKTVNVRSMGSQHVGVFFDGMQIGNAQNGTVDLGRFSLDNMESVSLHNGQRSSIFQSAKDFASASAIYMETRRPVFDGSRSNDNLKLTFKTGSFKTVNPALLWEHRFNDNVAGSFSAEYMHTSGEYKFRYRKLDGYDTTEVRKNGQVGMFRAEAALFGRTSRGEWKTKAYFYDSERGYPGAVVREEPGRFRHEDRQWDTNFFLQGSMKHKVNNFYTFMLNAKYAYDYLHYLADPDDYEPGMYVNNRYRQQELYLSASNLFSILPWWSADVAVDAQWNHLDADLYNFVYPDRGMLMSAAATSVQLNAFSAQASLLYTHVADRTRRKGAQADDKNVFSPTVMASWQPSARHEWFLRAFYKQSFRMPTFNDLYYTEIGNKNLDPEYTTQYNIGSAYSKNWPVHDCVVGLDTQLDAYRNKIHDMIVAIPGGGQFRWIMLNYGYVEINGIDAVVQGRCSTRRFGADLRISYTWQLARNLTDPQSLFYGSQIPYIPVHSGSAIAGVSFGRWNLNYSFIYTGERYMQADSLPEDYVQPWYTHDMAVSYRFDLPRSVIDISLEINNIFNQQYEVVSRYPMPGTNFKLILSITL